MAVFSRVFQALRKTRTSIHNVFGNVSGKKLTPHVLDELEEQLLGADLGLETTDSILSLLEKIRSNDAVKTIKDHLVSLLPEVQENELNTDDSPVILMVVGINGTGKTTTTAKLASYYRQKGENVLLIAADTYRAAAVEQLRVWSEKIGIKLVCNEQSQEPTAVLFDGLESAKAQGSSLVIVDTAGRLHTYKNLMAELEKMYRVIQTRFPEFTVHSWITIDANLGQNSLLQAKEFASYINVDGAILTKMDGTAKGGIVFPLYGQLQIPVQFLGIGEQLDDLFPFKPSEYIESLFGNDVEE